MSVRFFFCFVCLFVCFCLVCDFYLLLFIYVFSAALCVVCLFALFLKFLLFGVCLCVFVRERESGGRGEGGIGLFDLL